MNLSDVLRGELALLETSPRVNRDMIGAFGKRIASGRPLLREENREDHVCSFFLPVHRPSGSVYLVHHIKAQGWIPPGGHIDAGETPRQTVRREFREELDFTLTNEPVTLIDLSIKHINAKTHPCKVHYDFWYTVDCSALTPFRFLKDEFYDAGWYPLARAVEKTNHDDYRSIMRKIDLKV